MKWFTLGVCNPDIPKPMSVKKISLHQVDSFSLKRGSLIIQNWGECTVDSGLDFQGVCLQLPRFSPHGRCHSQVEVKKPVAAPTSFFWGQGSLMQSDSFFFEGFWGNLEPKRQQREQFAKDALGRFLVRFFFYRGRIPWNYWGNKKWSKQLELSSKDFNYIVWNLTPTTNQNSFKRSFPSLMAIVFGSKIAGWRACFPAFTAIIPFQPLPIFR